MVHIRRGSGRGDSWLYRLGRHPIIGEGMKWFMLSKMQGKNRSMYVEILFRLIDGEEVVVLMGEHDVTEETIQNAKDWLRNQQ